MKQPNQGDCRVKLQPKTIDDRAVEQRDSEKRRKPSLRTLWAAISKHRRRHSRREDDHLNSYTDWYGHWPLAATFTIILLCFADAFLTIVLLSKGAVEMNVLMDYLIQKKCTPVYRGKDVSYRCSVDHPRVAFQLPRL